LYVNGTPQSNIKVTGSVIAQGTILGQGKNNLIVSIENGLVDRFFSFTNYDAPRYIELQVNHNGTITETSERFYITGESVQGSIVVTISGTVEKPTMKV
jgi:hypothetical protein